MNPQTTRKLARALVAVGCILTAPLALAQENYLIDNFDDITAYEKWQRWWGSATQVYSDGEGMDANGDIENSGSLKAEIGFDLATHGGDNQFALVRYFDDGVIDGTTYTNFVFQLYWDGSSPLNSGGTFGTLEVGFVDANWGQITPLYYSIPADTADQWILVECEMDPATPGIDTIQGVFLKIWSGNDGGLTGNTTFWVDDVMLLADASVGPPPVEVAMAPAHPGLQIFASDPTWVWQRQNIRTKQTDAGGAANNYSWVGTTGPTSYSVTLADLPGPDAYDGAFQAHMFLVPEDGMQWGIDDTSQDWNATNAIFVTITANDEGQGVASFRYKTDGPGHTMINNDNPDNGPVGYLGDLVDVSPEGTWTFTFQNDTDVTVTGPGGATADYTIPTQDAARFADPIIAYFGIQPNGAERIGMSGTYSRIQISGSGTTLDETFDGTELNTDLWAVVAGNASGINVVPEGSALWIQWNAPATGHVLATSPDLATWTTPDLPVIQIGAKKAVLVPQSALPTPNAFVRTIKPEEPAP